jgi:heat shock protein HslJ
LAGNQWELLRYGPADSLQTAVPGLTATLDFEENLFSGTTGCNRFGGSYTLRKQTIQISNLTGSTADCIGHLRQRQESQMLRLLQEATTFSLDTQLSISGPSGQLIFQPARQQLTAVALPTLDNFYGVVWQIVAVETASGFLPAQQSGLGTAQFMPKTVAGDGGCNRYAAALLVVEAAFFMQLGNVEHSQETCDVTTNQFETMTFDLLEKAESFELTGETLTIYAANGSLAYRRMANSTYHPPFVALTDGTICSRTAADDQTAVADKQRIYQCSQTASQFVALFGDLTPTDNGWQTTKVTLQGNEADFTVASVAEVEVVLPRP